MKNKPNQSVPTNTLEQDIAEIEAMTDDEIDRELVSYGIDPQRAIAKVTRNVRNKLSEWDRGPLHAKEDVVHPTPVPHAFTGEE
jgi:hypothetical protein